MNVLEILSTRFSQLQLKGFRSGYTDAAGTRLMAFSLLSVTDADYEDLHRFYLTNEGHSYVLKNAGDTCDRVDLGGGTYSTKGYAQMIQEGILHFVRTWFYGVFFDREWYILSEYRYYAEEDEAKLLSIIEAELTMDSHDWNEGVFRILPAFEEKIDFAKAASMLSAQTGKSLNQFDNFMEVAAYVNQLAKDSIPMHHAKESADFRQFVGQPWLVAYQKKEIKEKINRQFETYINEAVFVPLVKMLKIQHPGKFVETYTLYHPDYFPLIYPHSKEQILCVVKAAGKTGDSRLYYFLYIVSEKQLYEWRLPKPANAAGHHASHIIEDIKDLSAWGNEFDFSDPSITMDDPQFWREYVLKVENGSYKYLLPVQIENYRKDIYNMF